MRVSTTSAFVCTSLVVLLGLQSTDGAELSGDCLAESQELSRDAVLVGFRNRLANEVNNIPLETFCSAVGGTTLSCTFDYNDFNTQDIKEECELVDGDIGRYVETSSSLTCTGNANPDATEDFTYQFEYVDVPSCVGKSCSADDLKAYTQSLVDDEVAQLEAQGFDCSSSSNVEDGNDQELNSGANTYNTFVSITIAVVVVAVTMMMSVMN